MTEPHSRPSQAINKRVRFTSNVLRSVGVANDALCLVIGFFVAVFLYQLTFLTSSRNCRAAWRYFMFLCASRFCS